MAGPSSTSGPAIPGLVTSSGQPITRADIMRARTQANAGRGFANAYDAASHDGAWTSHWRPAIMSPDREYLPNRDLLVARARDLARNDPTAGAAISRRKNSAVGKGWRLSSKPNALALGITLDEARKLGRQIESEWRMYTTGHNFQADAERRLNFAQQLRVAAHHFMADGEGCGLAEYAPDENTRYATRLRIVDPDRLSNPIGQIDDQFWRGGIQHNAAGVPIRYWFRQAHPGDFAATSMAAFTWLPFDRFTAWGRPQVFHWFDPERAAQSRGVTRFVNVLKSFRALSRFTDATLQNATINALFAAFVQSSAGPEAVSESLNFADLAKHENDRESFYDDNPILLGGDVRIPVLPLGDKIEMATAERDVTAFDAFVRAVIRLIASSLGVTYEEVSMDYSQTNYSSARAALIHAAAETEAMQMVLEAQLVRPFFVAWLEEAIDKGYVQLPAGAPDFYDAVDAYAEARWIGPKRGYIDPTKEILAAAARIEAGVSTLESECATLEGTDWEEVLEQAAIEQRKRIELGLQPTGAAEAQAIQDTKNPAKSAPSPADPSGDPETQVAPEDQRPKDPNAPANSGARAAVHRIARRADGSALAAIARFADTQAHTDFLDRRAAA